MIENPNLANERIKYNSVEDLLIDELNIGIALIESYIEENAYIYVFVAPGGGSKGGLAPEVKVPDMINVHLTNLISQLLLWISIMCIVHL